MKGQTEHSLYIQSESAIKRTIKQLNTFEVLFIVISDHICGIIQIFWTSGQARIVQTVPEQTDSTQH